MTDRSKAVLAVPGAIVALVIVIVGILSAAQFARAGDVEALQVKHNSDIDRVERKLDCALFDLPRGCRETMAPRSP